MSAIDSEKIKSQILVHRAKFDFCLFSAVANTQWDVILNWTIVPLLVPDGFDRVEVGGFAGRVPAEEDADYGADEEGDDDAPRLDEDRVGEYGLDYVRGRYA